MSENDFLVENTMRRLNPVPTASTDGLDQRASDELVFLLTSIRQQQPIPSDGVSRKKKRKALAGFALAASVAVVAAAITFSNFLGASSTAVASIPSALVTEHIETTKGEILDVLAGKAANIDSSTTFDPGKYRYQWWEEAGGPKDSSVILPVTNIVDRKADGSRTLIQVMGQPFSQVSGKVKFVDPDGKEVVPGTETTTRQSAAEYSMDFSKPPAENPKELAAQLDHFVENNPLMSYNTGAGRIDALGYMLASWKFSPDANEAVIEYLGSQVDVRFDGKVTDRLGRVGYLFGIAEASETPEQPAPDARSSVILDANTGSLIGYERMSTDGSVVNGGSTTMTVTRYIAAE